MSATRPSVSLSAALATAARDAGISLSAALQHGVRALLVAGGHDVPSDPAPTRTSAATATIARRRREAPAK